MKVQAAAKINLMLDVLGRLPDGYHSLFMVMQSVGCYDTVDVQKTTSGRIEIITDDDRVPRDEKNIAYAAAQRFFDVTGIQNPGISIEIDKQIPMAAGLAGGSADAAGVLTALNRLFDAGLSGFSLQRIGEMVGADVPFSLHGGTALCLDKGGVIAPLLPLRKQWVVLCKPTMDVSTVSAYRKIDEAPRLRHADRSAMLTAVHTGDFKTICEKADNVFEQVIEVPARPVIKGKMRQFHANLTLMSGSGPTVYGLFDLEEDAQNCCAALQKEFPETILCTTVQNGVQVTEE